VARSSCSKFILFFCQHVLCLFTMSNRCLAAVFERLLEENRFPKWHSTAYSCTSSITYGKLIRQPIEYTGNTILRSKHSVEGNDHFLTAPARHRYSRNVSASFGWSQCYCVPCPHVSHHCPGPCHPRLSSHKLAAFISAAITLI